MILQENVALRVRRDLFPGKPLHKAILHAYDGDPRDLEVAAKGESVAVRIPRLDLWGIIELQ